MHKALGSVPSTAKKKRIWTTNRLASHWHIRNMRMKIMRLRRPRREPVAYQHSKAGEKLGRKGSKTGEHEVTEPKGDVLEEGASS